MFTLPGSGTLTIAPKTLAVLWSHAQRGSGDAEAGGMLIGHHPDRGGIVILDRQTTPQPEDRRTRTRFYRDQASHQVLLDAAWAASSGRRTYVGEWHTHPEAHPTPSCLDRRSWRRALRDTGFHGPGLVFIIVGVRTTRIWFGTRAATACQLIGEVPTGEQRDQETQ